MTRIQLQAAWAVLRGRSVVYRVFVSHGGTLTPEVTPAVIAESRICGGIYVPAPPGTAVKFTPGTNHIADNVIGGKS